jgi:hypothetical protein
MILSGGRFLVGLAVPALAVGGCGTSDSGGGSTGSRLPLSLTKAQFLKKANAICSRGNEEMARLDVAAWERYNPDGRPITDAVSDKVALALLPAREKELRRIRALGPPQGDEQYVDRMLDAWQEGIRRGREDHSSLRAGDTDFAFYEAYSMGLDYGLVECWLG